MPYIIQTKRDSLDPTIDQLVQKLLGAETIPLNNMEGNINYVITKLLKTIYTDKGYRGINDAIGVLECAKLEFYRRVAVPYEDQKKYESGDV